MSKDDSWQHRPPLHQTPKFSFRQGTFSIQIFYLSAFYPLNSIHIALKLRVVQKEIVDIWLV